MKCDEVRDSLEVYINGELDARASSGVAEHLRACPECAREYETTRALVARLREVTGQFQPKGIFDMRQLEDYGRQRRGSTFGSRLLAAVAVLAVALASLSGSLLAFPALAKQIPSLPIAQDIQALEEKNKVMQGQIERLKVEMREIKGTDVKVVETVKPPFSEQENLDVQGMIMDFVRAQYAGDVATMKRLATPELAERIDRIPAEFDKRKGGAVAFGSITSVAKQGDDYLVFVRISDTREFVDSEYQENFTVKKVDGAYLIDNMEMDA